MFEEFGGKLTGSFDEQSPTFYLPLMSRDET